jgi:hypothetical protein
MAPNKYNRDDSLHSSDHCQHEDILSEIREDVNHLYKTIYQGNGTPSLTTQVTKLELRINALESKLESSFKAIDSEISLKFKNITDVVNEKFAHLSYQISNEFEKKRHEASGKWTFKTGVFTATMAGICSILTMLIAEIVKRW